MALPAHRSRTSLPVSACQLSPLNLSTSQQLNTSTSASGFTLIELLVVITLIIILMAMLFPAFRGVQNQAKKAQAKNDLTQIVTAVNAFYTEYGKYPTAEITDVAATYGS